MRAVHPNPRITESQLIQACIANIRNALGDVTVKFAPSRSRRKGDLALGDGHITVKGPWGTTQFVVAATRGLSVETAKVLITKLWELRSPPLLITEYANPVVSALLHEQGINFVDTAGNIFLKTNSYLVRLEGHKRPMPTHRPARPFQVAGLKILSVLLWEPQTANATYRQLAQRAGVSLGAIVPVFEDLAKDGFLRTTKQGRNLVHPRELLEQWVLGYAGQLFPRIFLQTCRLANNRTLNDLADSVRRYQGDGQVLLGGEAAAGLLTAYLRPDRATVHVPPLAVMNWMAQARLIPDPKGNIDLVVRFADGNQWQEPPAIVKGVPTASPILVYGELMRQGLDARIRDTASKIFEQFIAPRFGEGE